uniref:MHC class I-like antigen recognition-like domain-containing protein n=1 Tax=Anguilla anguilla TaxID=7936 RepID=A0A0E9WHN8_ANGAN
MRVLGLLYVVLRAICWANAASHSLKYIYTVVTGDTDSPEFTIMGLVNDEQFVRYDSNIRRMIPQTEWMENQWTSSTGTNRLRKRSMHIRSSKTILELQCSISVNSGSTHSRVDCWLCVG